jgi:serine/threonine protein kinase
MIHEIKSKEFGNSQIARGAFGSISIAILQTEKSKDEEFSFFSFLAIKTISNPLSPSCSPSSSSTSTSDVPKLSLAVLSELAALRVLSSRQHQHENITPLLSVMTSGSTKSQHHVQDDISLVFPYCPIDLHEIIQSRRFGKGPLQLSFIRTIFKDILRGLQHVHATGIIHADMKPGNIFKDGPNER